jgi:hypothetical protein
LLLFFWVFFFFSLTFVVFFSIQITVPTKDDYGFTIDLLPTAKRAAVMEQYKRKPIFLFDRAETFAISLGSAVMHLHVFSSLVFHVPDGFFFHSSLSHC